MALIRVGEPAGSSRPIRDAGRLAATGGEEAEWLYPLERLIRARAARAGEEGEWHYLLDHLINRGLPMGRGKKLNDFIRSIG